MLAVVESELSWQETHVAGIISGIMLILCFENRFTAGTRVVKHGAFQTQHNFETSRCDRCTDGQDRRQQLIVEPVRSGGVLID